MHILVDHARLRLAAGAVSVGWSGYVVGLIENENHALMLRHVFSEHQADLALLEKGFRDERKASTRLSLAFALVLHGKTELSEFSPLRYLISNLNSKAYRGVAQPFLMEAARDVHVLHALHRALGSPGTREERTGLAAVLATSGDAASAPILQAMSKESDPEVAAESLRALRSLKARLP